MILIISYLGRVIMILRGTLITEPFQFFITSKLSSLFNSINGARYLNF